MRNVLDDVIMAVPELNSDGIVQFPARPSRRPVLPCATR